MLWASSRIFSQIRIKLMIGDQQQGVVIASKLRKFLLLIDRVSILLVALKKKEIYALYKDSFSQAYGRHASKNSANFAQETKFHK